MAEPVSKQERQASGVRGEWPSLPPKSVTRSVARAEPPAAPALSRGAARAVAERESRWTASEEAERRSMLRGLILLAILVCIIALAHHGMDAAFPAGWWRRW